MNFNSRSQKATIQKILKYLESNPKAMDSEKGISSWWVHETTKNTHSALIHMVALNILKTKEINGEVYYFLNESFRKRIGSKDLTLSTLSQKRIRDVKKTTA